MNKNFHTSYSSLVSIYYRAGLDELCHLIGLNTLEIAQVKSYDKTFRTFKLLYTSIFLACWLNYTNHHPVALHSLAHFREFMSAQQLLHPNVRFWWKFLSDAGTPDMFDTRTAACVKFAPLWASWHKTIFFRSGKTIGLLVNLITG